MDKYRVKSFYHKSYGSAPEVRYKVQMRIMGFWSNMDDNFETNNREFINRICEELNIPCTDKSSYVVYVKQSDDQVEANTADLTVVNQKTHVIKRLQDVIFNINKFKIEEL